MKSILITGGGTAERIDSVRRITNDSTGALAANMCEQFLQSRFEGQVIYVAAKGAVLPKDSEKFSENGKLKIVRIESANDALTAMQNLCSQFDISAIIHSMAVSDFCVQNIFDAAQVCDLKVSDLLSGTKDFTGGENRGTKISSEISNPIVVLGQTPKIISHLRGFAPSAVIVGFKLLSDVSENELWQVASSLLQKNQLDFVIANDSKYFSENRHVAFLIDKDYVKNCTGQVNHKIPVAIEGKNEIAKIICQSVLEKLV